MFRAGFYGWIIFAFFHVRPPKLDGGGFRVDDFSLGLWASNTSWDFYASLLGLGAGWFRLLPRSGCVGY